MEDVFEEKICTTCKKSNTEKCKKNIVKKKENDILSIKCLNYVKDLSKIKKYEKPLITTARRESIN